jgi:hypothetical protein
MRGCAAVLCVVLVLASAGPLYVGKCGEECKREWMSCRPFAPPRSSALCMGVSWDGERGGGVDLLTKGAAKEKKNRLLGASDTCLLQGSTSARSS